ncbi:hypothetical protein NDU88_006257 [Pleurodeles waltl]|uniref:Uncharacterized protein n=1 Tax=Pleurodeles waltl TaxID=8319 RepID=A0AAV7TDW6_PLEWA|nr:hypothetical protein NDU88_006257 [Pleurodeles waltl]
MAQLKMEEKKLAMEEKKAKRALAEKKLSMQTEEGKMDHDRSLRKLDIRARQAEYSNDDGSMPTVPSRDKSVHSSKGLVPDFVGGAILTNGLAYKAYGL